MRQVIIDGVEYVPKEQSKHPSTQEGQEIPSNKGIDVQPPLTYFKRPEADAGCGWEIVAFKSSLQESGLYRYSDTPGEGWTLDVMLKNHPINSVKRLSDEVVFSVGDEVDALGDIGTISSIVLHEGAPYPVLKYKNELCSVGLFNAKKPTPPRPVIFTTENLIKAFNAGREKFGKEYRYTNAEYYLQTITTNGKSKTNP